MTCYGINNIEVESREWRWKRTQVPDDSEKLRIQFLTVFYQPHSQMNVVRSSEYIFFVLYVIIIDYKAVAVNCLFQNTSRITKENQPLDAFRAFVVVVRVGVQSHA